jgi:hypothetical protein
MSRKGVKQPGVESMRQTDKSPGQMLAPAENGNGSSGKGGSAPEPGNGSFASPFSSDEVAQRAYQIFEREGRMDGRDMEHWLQAERELRSERERTGSSPNAQNAPRSARQHQRS